MTETVRFALTLTVVGVVIVFTVLALVASIVALVRKLDDRWQQKEREVEESRTARPPTIDATTLVILTAAAATVIGGRFRFRSVRRVGSAQGAGSSWSQQGRAVLMGSHVIDRHSPETRHSGGDGRTH